MESPTLIQQLKYQQEGPEADLDSRLLPCLLCSSCNPHWRWRTALFSFSTRASQPFSYIAGLCFRSLGTDEGTGGTGIKEEKGNSRAFNLATDDLFVTWCPSSLHPAGSWVLCFVLMKEGFRLTVPWDKDSDCPSCYSLLCFLLTLPKTTMWWPPPLVLIAFISFMGDTKHTWLLQAPVLLQSAHTASPFLMLDKADANWPVA